MKNMNCMISAKCIENAKKKIREVMANPVEMARINCILSLLVAVLAGVNMVVHRFEKKRVFSFCLSAATFLINTGIYSMKKEDAEEETVADKAETARTEIY